MLRDAIVETGALLYRLAPERHSLASVFDRRPWRRVTRERPARAEIFDLGYQGYEGERTSRWRRRRAIWRDGMRISLGLGRGTGAKIAPWLLIALALAPMAVLVVLAAFLGSVAERLRRLRAALVRRVLRVRDRPARAVRGRRRAAARLPRPAATACSRSTRRGRSRRPTTSRSRWSAFFTVAAVVAWLPEAVLFVWNLLDAQRHRLVDRRQLGHRAALPRLGARASRSCFTTLALFVSSFTTRRAYAAIGMLAVLFIGGAVGGIAHDNFDGALVGRALARPT